MLEKRAGGLLTMARLVEAAERFRGGRLSLEELGAKVRTLIPASVSPPGAE
jgi:hypothetical protein